MTPIARALGVLTAAAGALLATRPRDVAQSVGGGHPPEAWIVRALGARMVLQGAVLAARPSRRVAAVCGSVDIAHAASMIGAAAYWPRYRHAAWVSAGVASGAAAISGFIAGRRA